MKTEFPRFRKMSPADSAAPHLLLPPQVRTGNGGRTTTLLPLLMAAVFLLAGTGGLRAEGPPAPETDFLRMDMGPLLPEKVSAGVDGGVINMNAAATGDGGWLVAWSEAGRQGEASRLVARLLPPELRGPVNGQGNEESGFASEPVFVPVSAGYPSFLTVSGNGGAWMTWVEAGQVRARWFDQAARGPVGETLTISGERGQTAQWLTRSAGDGQRAWLVWKGSGDGGDFWAGAVVENTVDGPVLGSRFTLPQRYTATVKPVAAAGRCVFCLPAIGPDAGGGQAPKQELVVVDAAGKVSGPHPLDLPEGAAWTGVVPTEDGFLGLWQVDYVGTVIYKRELTLEGDWKEGAAAAVLAALPQVGEFTPGRGGMVFTTAANGAVYLKPDGSWWAIKTLDDQDNNVYATDKGQVLQVCDNPERDQVRARELPYTPSATYPATLTSGTGNQTAPSLAWTSSGPQVVFQAERYGYDAGGQVTGYNKQVNAPGGLAFSSGAFSSPAQAWQGNDLQLVAYRRANVYPLGADAQADIDDVMGVFFKPAPDGGLVQQGAPFGIATGPGSQRGVAVASLSNGFVAAWREESGSQYSGNYLSSVRAAVISATGAVTPPGGQLLDIGVGEISAVTVDSRGLVS